MSVQPITPLAGPGGITIVTAGWKNHATAPVKNWRV